MKNVYLVGLLFCTTLHLTIGLNIIEVIKSAQCKSFCLRKLTINDQCWNETNNDTKCQKCWDTCEFLGPFGNKLRLALCKKNIYSTCPDCQVACRFYRTHGIYEEEYETTKLPAPEKDDIININKHDVAVILHKNIQGMWDIKNDYTTNRNVVMKPGNWIIVTNETGAIKQYSWEKWKPTLKSGKKSGPLFQINITWTDWQAQLEKQWENISMPPDIKVLAIQNNKKAQSKPSFVVTWQEKMGNGIKGNQVADSESAQISVPPGEYSVRIATNNGPGSYAIVINTDKYTTEESHYFNWSIVTIIVLLPIITTSTFIFICSLRQKRKKKVFSYNYILNMKRNNIEMVQQPLEGGKNNRIPSDAIFSNNDTNSNVSSTCPLIKKENSEQIPQQKLNSDTSSSTNELKVEVHPEQESNNDRCSNTSSRSERNASVDFNQKSNSDTSSNTYELNVEVHPEQESNNDRNRSSTSSNYAQLHPNSSSSKSNVYACNTCEPSSTNISPSNTSDQSGKKDLNANFDIEDANLQNANEQDETANDRPGESYV